MSDPIKLRQPEDMILTQDDLNLCLGSKELLACPFCGSKKIISHGSMTTNGKAVRWEIACIRMEGLRPVCAASVWGTDPDQATARKIAVEKWNRRPSESQLRESVRRLVGAYNAASTVHSYPPRLSQAMTAFLAENKDLTPPQTEGREG